MCNDAKAVLQHRRSDPAQALDGVSLEAQEGGIVAIVLIVAAALLAGRREDYKVLFANLSDKDGGAVVAGWTFGMGYSEDAPTPA